MGRKKISQHAIKLLFYKMQSIGENYEKLAKERKQFDVKLQ